MALIDLYCCGKKIQGKVLIEKRRIELLILKSWETVGVMGFNDDGEFGEMDAALSLACHSPATQ